MFSLYCTVPWCTVICSLCTVQFLGDYNLFSFLYCTVPWRIVICSLCTVCKVPWCTVICSLCTVKFIGVLSFVPFVLDSSLVTLICFILYCTVPWCTVLSFVYGLCLNLFGILYILSCCVLRSCTVQYISLMAMLFCLIKF